MWSDWIYKGLPDLGDLVIADCYHQDDPDLRQMKEGIVAGIEDSVVRFIGEPKLSWNEEKWIVTRWKKWLPSEGKEVTREVELELS